MAEEKALRMIAIHADGSLRDALSCLDPCIAAGKEVDTDFVADFLGRAENDAVLELCKAIGECDGKGVVSCIDDVCSRGKNLTPFIEVLISALRDMLIVAVSGKSKSDFDEAEYRLLEEYASMYSTEKLLYAIKSLSEANQTARFMTNPRVIYEAALIKLCIKTNDGSYDSLMARIAELERKIESGVTVVKQTSTTPSPEKVGEDSAEEIPEKINFNDIPASEFLERIKSSWPEVMNDLSGSILLFTALENVTLFEENGKLALVFPDEGGREMQDMVRDGINLINSSVKAHTGLDANAVTRLESDFTPYGKKKFEHDPLDDIINLPITNIE